MANTIPVVTDIVHTYLIIVLEIWVFQYWLADLWGVFEAGADCVHDGLTLHLSSISSIINNNRWDNVSAVGVPVFDFFIYYFVLRLELAPFVLIGGSEGVGDALVSLVPVEAMESTVCVLRAIVVDVGAALIMYGGHISEEEEALILIIDLLINTFLSQILKDDLFAFELVSVVGRAISSAREAVGLDEILSAVHALPVDEVWGHEHLLAELSVNILEVLDEIEDEVVVAGVPDVVLDTIIRPLHFEFNDNGNLVSLFFGCCFHEIDQLLSIFVGNQHGWDSKTGTTSIIRHDDFADVLLLGVDDNGEASSCLLNISYLLNKSAIASISQVEGGIVEMWLLTIVYFFIKILIFIFFFFPIDHFFLVKVVVWEFFAGFLICLVEYDTSMH